MLHIIGKIPHRVTIACSGGIDSMVALHFLLQGKRKVDVVYFNHDTLHSRNAEQFVKRFCGKNKLLLTVGRIKGTKGRKSMEEFWRDERYKFLNSTNSNYILAAHHLDDVVETWLMSSFHGTPKLIPYARDSKIYRPFLLTPKKNIIDYASSHKLEWIEDPSNENTNHKRNLIRHEIVPRVLKVNPGLRKTIRKKLLEKYRDI